MSASAKLPVIAAVAGAGASLAAMASSSTLRAYLSRVLGVSAPGGVWRLIALVLAAVNLKNLPFMWHIRLFRGLIYQLYLQPTPFPPHALFQPIITSTRSPLAECDYNLHKSNSTYFSDLDISRTHLVTALLRHGIRQLSKSKNPAERAPGTEHVPDGSFAIALGAITCHFRREIVPYARFEIWTRLLCWDRKWLYLVSHMVRPGVAKPPSFTLQPWRRARGGGHAREMAAEEAEQLRERLKGAVFATSIAKYVVKKGRWTVPPERVLLNSGLLPGERPDGVAEANGSAVVNGAATAPGEQQQQEQPVDGSYVLPAVSTAGDGEWTWEKIEAERQRGLKLAELFAGLDGLHDEFNGGVDGALGEYADMLTPFW
ncbi:putative 4hbt like protein [Neofusicoccum parvum]|nr:putative 4hbt like protein [Neofusicoccum parvum]